MSETRSIPVNDHAEKNNECATTFSVTAEQDPISEDGRHIFEPVSRRQRNLPFPDRDHTPWTASKPSRIPRGKPTTSSSSQRATRVPAPVTTAITQQAPFRWGSFIPARPLRYTNPIHGPINVATDGHDRADLAATTPSGHHDEVLGHLGKRHVHVRATPWNCTNVRQTHRET